nr:MAG TPA: hypothetical protein [Caudoviricetes sp.]
MRADLSKIKVAKFYFTSFYKNFTKIYIAFNTRLNGH